jgi:hypothetical protein
VVGIKETPKSVSVTVVTVRLMPSMAMEPLGTMYFKGWRGAVIRTTFRVDLIGNAVNSAYAFHMA